MESDQENSEKMKLFSNSDDYWDKYWSKIDKAKKFIFIITYDMDNKMIANLTLRKLIEALDRGVQVVLIVEHLNFYMKNSLYKQLKKNGAIIIKPNPGTLILSHIWNGQTKKFFNRCHQKVSLIDNDLFIGSINISDEYSDIKYGSKKFLDLNLYVKNTICQRKVIRFFKEFVEECDDQIRKLAAKEKLKKLFEEYLGENTTEIENKDRNNSQASSVEKLSSDSDNQATNNEKFLAFEEFLEEKPPQKSEIQDNLYDLLENSKESITIIQAYYNNLKRIEDILIRAIKRGVKVKIITAAKRDQIAYKYVYNSDLFSNLLKNGVEVEEFMDVYLHMKAYYVDNKYLSMGSLNNDRTSFIMNNEANYLIRRNGKNDYLFQDFEKVVKDLESNSKPVDLYIKKNPFRLAFSYWWYFFVWCMEKTVPNRKVKYDS